MGLGGFGGSTSSVTYYPTSMKLYIWLSPLMFGPAMLTSLLFWAAYCILTSF